MRTEGGRRTDGGGTIASLGGGTRLCTLVLCGYSFRFKRVGSFPRFDTPAAEHLTPDTIIYCEVYA